MTTVVHRRVLITGIFGLGILLLSPGPALALVGQVIDFAIDTDLSNTDLNDEDSAQIDDSGGPISSAITAAINGSSNGIGYTASGSVGPFGNFGLQAELLGGTQNGMQQATRVYIFNDGLVNPASVAQHATANFIIDGGLFTLMHSGLGSTLEYALTLSLDGNDVFQTMGILTTIDAAGAISFASSGADIDAHRLGTNDVEIPVSVQSVDLGIIPSAQPFMLEYLLEIFVDITEFTETTRYSFSDPLSVDGREEFPTVEFQVQMTPVPEPSALVLFAFGLVGLLFLRRSGRV